MTFQTLKRVFQARVHHRWYDQRMLASYLSLPSEEYYHLNDPSYRTYGLCKYGCSYSQKAIRLLPWMPKLRSWIPLFVVCPIERLSLSSTQFWVQLLKRKLRWQVAPQNCAARYEGYGASITRRARKSSLSRTEDSVMPWGSICRALMK